MAAAKYDTHVKHRLAEVRAWRIDGHTEAQIGQLLGISPKSVERYKQKYSQFGQALLESKQILISELEQSLFQTAKGGHKSLSDTKETWVLNKRTGGMEMVKREDIYKISQPNVTALKFALINLASVKWQDKRVVEQNTDEMASLMESIASFGKRK